MTERKYILLFGRTGSGKSALGNVLIGADKFKESEYSVSQTKDIQVESFEIPGVDATYYVADVIGIGDTSLNVDTVIFKLAELVKLIRYDGIHQIFFTADSRFTEKEVDAYRILSRVIFDEEVYKYTTIVRTKFSSFRLRDKCNEDIQHLKGANQAAFPVVSRIPGDKIVHVNNSPLEEDETLRNRRDSHEVLIKHLAKIKNELYRPKGIDDVDERVRNYIDEENSAKKKIKKLQDEIDEIRKNREADHQKLVDLEKELKKTEERLEQTRRDLGEGMKSHVVHKLTHDPDTIVRYSAVGVKLGSKALPIIGTGIGGLIGVGVGVGVTALGAGVGVLNKFVDVLRGK